MKTLLIAYGNPYRGDDGIGAWILQNLKGDRLLYFASEDRGEVTEDCKTKTLDKLILQELTLDLAETLAQYDRVVFIDAAISGEPVTWRELKANNVSSPLSHHLPPEKLLFYAELLYQKAPQAFLLSVRGDSFEFEEHLSPMAESNSRLALTQLEEFLS
jgi:hydrogenase maturation protease